MGACSSWNGPPFPLSEDAASGRNGVFSARVGEGLLTPLGRTGKLAGTELGRTRGWGWEGGDSSSCLFCVAGGSLFHSLTRSLASLFSLCLRVLVFLVSKSSAPARYWHWAAGSLRGLVATRSAAWLASFLPSLTFQMSSTRHFADG